MDLKDYTELMFEQVRLDASVEMTSDKEEFIKYVTTALIEADEIEDFVYMPFEGVGNKRHKIQIDGYSYNELDDYLCIFTSTPLNYVLDENLTYSEAEIYFNRAKYFLEDSSFIIKNAEETAPGYGLAIDIQQRYNKVRKYCIYLITDKLMSKNITEFKTGEYNGRPIEYHIWDIKRLHQLAESKTGKEDIRIKLRDFGIDGIPCLPASQTNDYIAYLCNIPGIILAKLYNSYGGRLLEGNVRSFLQTKGKVNKGIRNTILNNPTMFFAYNNGIAATAYNIEVEEIKGIKYITEITSLQIVNGGQTTASLAMALLNDKKDNSETKIKDIFVPMKLSIVSPDKAQELIPYISRYANSQNKVSEADLWSNHPFHIRMEEFSRRIIAPAVNSKQYGTKWYYERANGQYKQETYKLTQMERKRFDLINPKNQMFNKTELAKVINIYQVRPDVASTGGQKSFAIFAEWATKQWDKNNTYFNDDFFRKVIALNIIFKQADKIVRNQTWYNSYKANIVAYTISKIFYTVETNYQDKTISFRNIWNKQTLSSAWISQIEIVSRIMYNHLVSEDRLVENVTEWAKREACWDRAKNIDTQLNYDFIKELIDKDIETEQLKEAQNEQKLTNKINAMVDIVNFGVENWKYLMLWGTEHNILSPSELSLLKYAVAMENGKFPSEKQCNKIIELLERARLESFPK
jgi:hypothetical protein